MDMKARGRLAGLALFFTAFVGANAFPSAGPATASVRNDLVVQHSPDHTAITAAEATARQYLARFLAHVLDSNGNTSAGAAVKISVPKADGGDEVIWVSPFARYDEAYIGLLADEPQGIDGYHQGDLIVFEAAQVRDWSFFGADGKMYGSYTTRVILSQLNPAHAKQLQDVLSAAPLPSNW